MCQETTRPIMDTKPKMLEMIPKIIVRPKWKKFLVISTTVNRGESLFFVHLPATFAAPECDQA